MNVLTTGMGWIDYQPGGLNRYFADYNHAMKQLGHSELGLVVGPQGQALPTGSLNITNVTQRGRSRDLLSRMKSIQRHSRQAVHEFRPDIYNPHFALYAALVSRNLIPSHVPIVTHFHGPWAMESKVEEVKTLGAVRETRYFLKKQLEMLTYRRSDSFIVLSEYFRDILIDTYGIDSRRINIIPGAVDHVRFKPHEDREGLRRRLSLDPGHTVLFCARRLVRRMGIDRLIEAMREVVKHESGVRLFIAGDGPMREEFAGSVERYGLSPYVKLLGRVSNEELVEWYQAADYSIVPTITLEGFGLVTVESLSCGTPVLGTPYGGTNEILSKLSGDLLFKDSSAEAIAAKLVSVLKQEGRIPSRETCREHVMQNYTWSRVAESVTAVFREEVGKRKVNAK